MISKVNRSLVLLSLPVLLSACGGGGSSKSSNISTYDGVWSPSPMCSDDTSTDRATGVVTLGSSKTSIIITGATAKLSVIEYSASADCTGVNKDYQADIALTYGDDMPTASSICDNTKKVDSKIISMTLNGVDLSAEEIKTGLEEDKIPSLQEYGLMCTSSDGSRLYFGMREEGLGETDDTIPTEIRSDIFLEKQ